MGRPSCALLMVTDDPQLAEGVAAWVAGAGGMRHAADARTALTLIDREHPRLVIVDLLLPDLDGARLLADLRYRSGIRALGLSAPSRAPGVTPRLLLGGSSTSWLTAPFDGPEVRRQVRGATVTPAEALSGWVQLGGLNLDLDRRLLIHGGRTVSLGAREFALLVQLAGHHGRVISRKDLLERAFQGQAATESAVNVRIRSLRQKLASCPPLGDQLVTVYGVGYRWDALATPAPVVRTSVTARAG